MTRKLGDENDIEFSDADVDQSLLDYLLSLTPYERLLRHQQALEAVLAIREAGIRYYGFDPRSAHTAEPE